MIQHPLVSYTTVGAGMVCDEAEENDYAWIYPRVHNDTAFMQEIASVKDKRNAGKYGYV